MDALTPFLSGAASAALVTGVFGIIMYRLKRNDALKLAVRMLLYDRIKQTGKSYIARG